MSATKYLTTQPCYRDGVYHQAGVVLTVPADEKPSRTWELVSDASPAPEKAPEEKTKAPRGRASDSSPI